MNHARPTWVPTPNSAAETYLIEQLRLKRANPKKRVVVSYWVMAQRVKELMKKECGEQQHFPTNTDLNEWMDWAYHNGLHPTTTTPEVQAAGANGESPPTQALTQGAGTPPLIIHHATINHATIHIHFGH